MDQTHRRTRGRADGRRGRRYGVTALSAVLALVLLAALVVVSTVDAAAQKTVTVKIGNITTLSGAAAQYGNSTTAGAQEAIDEINARGGVKSHGTTFKFSISSYDDQAQPAVAIGQFMKALSQGSTLMIGPTFGSVSTAMVSALRGKKAIMTITGGPVLGSLLATAPNAFQTQLDPSGEAEAVLWWAKKTHRKNIAIIADSTSTFDSVTFPASVTALAPKYGVNVQTVVGTSGPSQVDYSSQLLAISNLHPDALISAQTGNPNALIIKQARQAGYTFPIIATAGAPTLEYGVAGDAMNGSFDISGVTIATLAADGLAPAQTLQAKYQTKYKATLSDPGGTYSNAYTAVYAYATAIKATGTATDLKKLEAALSKVKVTSLPKVVQAKYIGQRGKLHTLYTVNKLAIPRIKILVWKSGAPVVYATYAG
jgi:branched-chain amino acid transport system substrate-binding protein